MLGFAQSDRHPTAQLATDAINMAARCAAAGVAGVIFHTDKGSQYTSDAFAAASAPSSRSRQSMGRSAARWTTPSPSRSSRRSSTSSPPLCTPATDEHVMTPGTADNGSTNNMTSPIERTSQRSLNQPSTGGKLTVGGPGTKARCGGPSVGELPVCGPGGVRCIGGVSSSQALAWNRRTCRPDRDGRCSWPREGEPQAAGDTASARVPMRGTGADRPVVAVRAL